MTLLYDPEEKCKQAIIFARVSTKDQFVNGASIPAQIQKMKEYCEKKNLRVLKIFEIPESSTNGERKLFYEMINYVKAQNHKTAITVYCIDRLQRGYNECATLDQLRLTARIELHFYKEGLVLDKDSNSSEISRWDFGILGAKMYVGALRDNVKRTQEFKRKEGQWLAFAPIGYMNITTEDGKSDVVIDPERGPIVQMLFKEYATGNYSLQDLEAIAHKFGLKSRRRKCTHTIGRGQIHDMLRNPFYYGMMRIHRKSKQYNVSYLPHRHTPLISEELFNQVQDVLNGRKQVPSKPWYREQNFVLRGLVRCAHCGKLMTTEQHTKKSGLVFRYLKCNNKNKTCHQELVSEEEILQQFEDQLFGQMNFTPAMIKNIQAVVKEKLKEDSQANSLYKKKLTEQLQLVEDRKKKLLVAWLDSKIDEATYKNMTSDTDKEIASIQAQIDKYANYNKELDSTLEKISDIALHAKSYFQSSIISKKHEILKLLLSNSEVNGKKLTFSIIKPFDKLLFSKGCMVWYLQSDSN